MEQIPEIKNEQIDITLVGETRIKSVNAEYRDKDAPTDVLSFRLDPDPGPDPGPFGAIIICPRFAAKDAKRLDTPLNDHLEELVLHALLHITGSDHHTDAEYKAMQRRHARILGKIRRTIL